MCAPVIAAWGGYIPSERWALHSIKNEVMSFAAGNTVSEWSSLRKVHGFSLCGSWAVYRHIRRACVYDMKLDIKLSMGTKGINGWGRGAKREGGIWGIGPAYSAFTYEL